MNSEHRPQSSSITFSPGESQIFHNYSFKEASRARRKEMCTRSLLSVHYRYCDKCSRTRLPDPIVLHTVHLRSVCSELCARPGAGPKAFPDSSPLVPRRFPLSSHREATRSIRAREGIEGSGEKEQRQRRVGSFPSVLCSCPGEDSQLHTCLLRRSAPAFHSSLHVVTSICIAYFGLGLHI